MQKERSVTENLNNIGFEDIFTLDNIQQMQDLFSAATGVASIILNPDGTRITRPSNFCNYCSEVILKHPYAGASCFSMDAGNENSTLLIPELQYCKCRVLQFSSAPVTVGGQHIATWFIGHVKREEISREELTWNSSEMVVNSDEMIKSLEGFPAMTTEQFQKVSAMLLVFARELSEKGYSNLQLKREITVRKHAEERLKELNQGLQKSEQFLNELQKLAGLGNYILDFSQGTWSSSEILDEIFGIDNSFPRTMDSWHSLIHPEYMSVLKEYFEQEILPKKCKFEKEYKIIRHSDKAERWVHRLGEIEYDQNGNPFRMIGTVRDITDWKLVQEALLNERLLLRTLIDNIPDSIYSKDLSLKKTLANKADVKFIGARSEAALLGKDDFYFYPKEIAEKFYADDQQVLQTGKPILNREEYLFDEDGNIRWLLSSKLPLRDKDGQIIGLVGIGRDITERKQVEERLVLAEEKTEESNLLKTAFLNNISHEIRTPFSGILGFLSFLQNEGLTGSEKDEDINIINQSSTRLMNTISDIVEISQIQTGQMKLTESAVNMQNLTETIVNRFKPDAEAKGLSFIVNIPLSQLPSTIFTDGKKLNAILSNLLANAVKFTRKGSVEFGMRLLTDTRPFSICFYVQDTGIGIPPSKHQQIFEKFMQADVSNTREFEGSGLGLSIAKAYVEMLGGEIKLESEEEVGSTFSFIIPVKDAPDFIPASDTDAVAESADDQIKSLKILIAEDDESSAYLITMAVKMFGKEVIRVRTGVEAVEACRNNSDIDLVMMDIKMPDMDGDEATREIRKFNTDVVIIAQTAYSMTFDRKMVIDAGCNDYITKPIKKDNLVVLINNYFKKQDQDV